MFRLLKYPQFIDATYKFKKIKKLFLAGEKMKGWIYIATNQSLTGLIKIGFTTKDPKLRLLEFNNAGLPHKHKLAYSALVEDPHHIEKQVHLKLKELNENKE